MAKEVKIKVYRIKPLGLGGGEPIQYLPVEGRHLHDLHGIIEHDMGGNCSIKIVEMTEKKFDEIPEL